MRYQRNEFEDLDRLNDKRSFRVRSMNKQIQRSKTIKKQIILINAFLAAVVIILAAAFSITKISKSEKGINLSDKTVLEAKKTDNNSDNSDIEAEASKTPEPTATPTPTPKVDGKDRWLRKDLDPDKPMVALTFDDGPYAPVTDRLLEILQEYDARATFFTVGNRISSYEASIKKAYQQGNQIASHTYSHAYLTSLSKSQIKEELSLSNKAIKKVIGCGFDALRPPGGKVSDSVSAAVNVPMIYWSIDTEDWKSRNAQKILERCEAIQDGDIVLMHDLYSTTADAVSKLVPRLVKQGYQLVTINELFYYKGINAKGGVVYYSAK